MKVGFTGTHTGMTAKQIRTLRDTLRALKRDEFHHGDCIGADAEAHDIAVALGFEPFIHPPINPLKRAYKTAKLVAPPYPYLERNRHIVDACGMLLACPSNMIMTVRSGTWSTVRYAVKKGRCHIIIFPDGSTKVSR